MKVRFLTLVTTGILLTGCGFGGTSGPSMSPSASNSVASTVSPTTNTQQATLYFVADNGTDFVLFSEPREVSASDDLVKSALDALITHAITPLDSDYTNLWTGGTTVNSVSVDGSLATVDLTLGKLNVGASGEGRAIDQLVWTVTTANPAITEVAITVDGKTVESLAGHVDASKPFTRADTYDVLSPVAISVPQENHVLSSPVTITGEACTFEANVVWELSQDGNVIKSGSTTAAEACPTRSPWTIELGALAPGHYRIRAFDLSAKDGSLYTEDTKDFDVQ